MTSDPRLAGIILRMVGTNALAASTQDVSRAAGIGSVNPVRPASAPAKSATAQRLLEQVPPAPQAPLPRGSPLDLRV